jgi:hypothetical protein
MNVTKKMNTGDQYAIKTGIQYIGSNKDKESTFVHENDRQMFGLDKILQEVGFETVLNPIDQGDKKSYVKMMDIHGRHMSVDTYFREDHITGDKREPLYDVRGLAADVNMFMQTMIQYNKN